MELGAGHPSAGEPVRICGVAPGRRRPCAGRLVAGGVRCLQGSRAARAGGGPGRDRLTPRLAEQRARRLAGRRPLLRAKPGPGADADRELRDPRDHRGRLVPGPAARGERPAAAALAGQAGPGEWRVVAAPEPGARPREHPPPRIQHVFSVPRRTAGRAGLRPCPVPAPLPADRGNGVPGQLPDRRAGPQRRCLRGALRTVRRPAGRAGAPSPRAPGPAAGVDEPARRPGRDQPRPRVRVQLARRQHRQLRAPRWPGRRALARVAHPTDQRGRPAARGPPIGWRDAGLADVPGRRRGRGKRGCRREAECGDPRGWGGPRARALGGRRSARRGGPRGSSPWRRQARGAVSPDSLRRPTAMSDSRERRFAVRAILPA